MKKSIYNVIIIILLGIIVGISIYSLFFNNEKKVLVDVKLNDNSINIYIGESKKLNVTLDPPDTDTELTWESSNKSIVEVNNGTITGKNIGDGIIIVKTKDDFSDTCIVHVINKKEKLELNKTNLSLKVGEKEKLIITADGIDKDNKEFTWASSDSSVAKVNNDGLVEGINVGTTKITISKDDVILNCIVNINEVLIDNITINKTNLIMPVSSKDELMVTITPDNATNKDIIWKSSDENIATVTNGKILAKKEGKVTITATTNNNLVAKSTINVVGINTFNIENKVLTEYLSNPNNIKSNYNKHNCGKVSCTKPNIYETNLSGDINIYQYNELDYSKKLIIKTDSKNINYYLLPNNTYYLEMNSDKNKVEVVRVTGKIRILEGLFNFRDLGGYKADNGTIKYGKLFRSGNTNELKNIDFFNYLGIKKIVDLRPDSEINSSSAVESIRERNSITYYTYTKEVRNAVEKVMKAVVNNNGVLFNCNFGRDRTGTIAYIIEGILGVSLEDRKTDFEITYFVSNKRTRSDGAFNGLIKGINKYEQSKYEQEKFINWYLSFSNNKESDLNLINNFRKMVIDGKPYVYKLDNDKLI